MLPRPGSIDLTRSVAGVAMRTAPLRGDAGVRIGLKGQKGNPGLDQCFTTTLLFSGC